MQEREIKIKSGDIFLYGSLTTPDTPGPHPLVICIHGSGPLDRNENIPFLKLNIFNALAEEMAGNGIACFRYDKRGISKSGGHFLSAGHGDLVADALAIAQNFEADPEVEKLLLLGHSEGTLIAPQVAQSCKVDGLILIAPFVTPLEEVLAWQGENMQRHIDTNKGITAWLVRQYTRFAGGVVMINKRLVAHVRRTSKPVIRRGLNRVPARWIRELLDVNPAAVFTRVKCPTLIVVAGADVQCPPEDGAEIAGLIGENATHILIPDLSHMLRFEGEKHGFADYGEQLKRPMEPVVIKAVAEWILAQDK
ncbi:MAG: lysophospholipase [Rhodobacteraceae bacterium]|nr:lysophospholipase [Paracoccaceae bacterium]